jgi:hypothetical protein
VLDDDAPAALQALFETRGTTLAGADALGPVLAGVIADSTQRPDLRNAAVVLPSALHPDRLTSRVDGDHLIVEGITTTTPIGRTSIVPVGAGRVDVVLALVPPETEWSQRAIEGTDPSMGLVRVAATFPVSECDWVDGEAARTAWTACAARARWALSAELVSIGHHVIDRAVEYTGQRQQYGRPIGSFQALQHRLAGAHASVVGASHVAAEAATSGSAWVALVAKALAGRAAENACTQAQQSYGAIGFTWEHEFHRYLRRTYVLDWLFGGWRTLEREIGARLIEERAIPRIGSL